MFKTQIAFSWLQLINLSKRTGRFFYHLSCAELKNSYDLNLDESNENYFSKKSNTAVVLMFAKKTIRKIRIHFYLALVS